MASSDQPRVFVYGTLKPGGYYWPRFCEGRVDSMSRARVRGRLFALPMGYPALVLGDGWAWGYLLTLRDSAVLKGFDTLEDFDPSRPAEENEYQRVKVDVVLENGATDGGVWAYVMDVEKVNALRGVIITNGEWVIDDTESLPSLD